MFADLLAGDFRGAEHGLVVADRHAAGHAWRVLELEQAAGKVGRDTTMPEVDTHTAGLGRREQQFVELGARHRPDHLVRALPIGQQGPAAVRCVQQSAAHRHEPRVDRVAQARVLERIQAASRERQVDRPAALAPAQARIRAPLIDIDVRAALGQHRAEQGPGAARTQDRDCARHRVSSTCASSLTQVATSEWEL